MASARGAMSKLKMSTAYAKRTNPIELANIFSGLPEEMARGCAAENGNGGHYKHKDGSGFWVIFGERDVALLRIDDISLDDANRLKNEIIQLRHFSDGSFAFAVERALKIRAIQAV